MLSRLKAAIVRAYVRWAARPGGRRDRRARLDRHAKCPACGYRKFGKIRWEPAIEMKDGTKGAIIRWCGECEAFWFERPVFPADTWSVELPVPKE